MCVKPEMILFDYGQTLIAEEKFAPLKGNQALLDIAVKNPNKVTARQVQELANALEKDLRDVLAGEDRNHKVLDVTHHAFNRYLYDYFEVEFAESPDYLEWLFWSKAAPGHPTKNIEKLLFFLHQKGIRTGVVSNMMNTSESLSRRLNTLLEEHHFEFILASSDYMFRKPHPRIFELALAKAKLTPEKVWFCGDNPVCDIEGAYYAGMKPVWYPVYNEGNHRIAADIPHIQINDWMDLIGMLEDSTPKRAGEKENEEASKS
ncbi:putative hydrolase of the HAD superfamily [Anaerocolumna jejuensis DSM 15929]|uniref:Putative hydrolase of the HAD superfamily n=1 Tax=Anaerocolumna jejuensis DSM 15929 TaxID=1121322 RepID=A0A1M6YKM2_9FIRM|nr:HAD-IIIA family hydrolase [Anaerocolumna jejuensis]SHL18569.1 putative hydrolase of the HAD superfamily [Anaerocolumna jejuensis DSM 15929]